MIRVLGLAPDIGSAFTDIAACEANTENLFL